MAPSADSPIKTGDDGTVCLPGFGIPLSYHHAGAFPALIAIDGEDWAATTLTIREVCMIRLVEDLTNKPEWWRKVKDPEIAAKWKKEALEMPWSEYVKYGHFEESMADAVRVSIRLSQLAAHISSSASRNYVERQTSTKRLA